MIEFRQLIIYYNYDNVGELGIDSDVRKKMQHILLYEKTVYEMRESLFGIKSILFFYISTINNY